MRHARLDKGERRRLGEAGGHEDELQLRVTARLQQLAQLLDADEVRGAAPILHGEEGGVAMARVVQPDAAAECHKGPQPVGGGVLEAQAQRSLRLSHRVTDELSLLVEVESVHRDHVTSSVDTRQRCREEHAKHRHLGGRRGAALRSSSPRELPPPPPREGARARAGQRGGRRVGSDVKVLLLQLRLLAVLEQLMLQLCGLAWREQRRVETQLADGRGGEHPYE